MRCTGPLSRPYSLPAGRSDGRRPATIQRFSRDIVAQAEARVSVKLQKGLNYGESLKVVGGHPSLGDWDLGRAPVLSWHEGDVWEAELGLPGESQFEFKVVHVGEGWQAWEEGDNRSMKVPASGEFTMEMSFGDTNERLKLLSSDGTAEDVQPAASAEKKRRKKKEEARSAQRNGGGGSAPEERLATQQWQGEAVQFMRSNDHTKDRSGKWDTSGLEGTLLALVEGDSKAGNWLQKLKLVERIIVDESIKQRPDQEALAAVYVYLQWIQTGAIRCVEGGSHYRPNHHANVAKRLFRSLEWVIEDATRDGQEAMCMLARRASRLLPSFDDQFTASVPLTRIRDIAHRNDIPHDLKQEIKHTLQNKLHRNAGPEDLVATEAMLERVTANPGEFNDGFVSEFKTFTAELRDFFNAGSLVDMLQELRDTGSLEDAAVGCCQQFIESKHKVDEGGPQAHMNDVMNALHRLTTVRAGLASGLSSGLRNDSPDASLSMRQKWRRAELRAEDYAFVLLARVIAELANRGGAEGLSRQTGSDAWAVPIGACVLSLRQLGLSGFRQKECLAVEHELHQWLEQGRLTEPDAARRAIASLERLQRLCSEYVGLLLGTLPGPANALGGALGIAPHMSAVFTEAEVRASLVFQATEVATVAHGACRLVVGASPWQAVVGGEVVGRLVEADVITPAVLEEHAGADVILLVRRADGDEEVAAAGANLRGVLLRQDIPHLSHLGVRARQEGVLLATCTQQAAVEEVEGMLGSFVRVTSTGSSIAVRPASEGDVSSGNGAAAPRSGAAPVATAARVDASRAGRVTPVAQATDDTCGAKSAAIGKLVGLQESPAAKAAGLRVPSGVCLPFGSMEGCVREAGRQRDFERLVGELEQQSGERLDAACGELQQLVAGCLPTRAVVGELLKAFPDGTPLMVRSSANVEDLAGMSGAGLYSSIPNQSSRDPAALAAAIAEVWASLFTRRAVLSRRAAGVSQGAASMSVLVQRMLLPSVSFVLHTVDHVSQDASRMSAEIAPGLGETLASAAQGSPYRMTIGKGEGGLDMTMESYANISEAIMAKQGTGKGAGVMVSNRVVDYSREPMSVNEATRESCATSLKEVGVYLEGEFGAPQDVEGCVHDGELYIVQTRPQPL